MMADMLKRTTLFAAHQKLGGKLVEFGGWEMPVQYTSITDEHLAVRNAAGIFDISHMGEVTVSGSGAAAFLNSVLTNDIRKLIPHCTCCLWLGRDRFGLRFRAPLKELHQFANFAGERHGQVFRGVILLPIALVGKRLQCRLQRSEVNEFLRSSHLDYSKRGCMEGRERAW